MKQIKIKRGKIILLIAVLQIVLLTIMIPAESYTIHQSDSSFENLSVSKEKDDKIKKMFDFGINLIIGFLSIKEIGFVSAQLTYCCMDTCSETSTDDNTCENLAQASCEDTGCELGCCYDSNEGTCSTGSPREKCESDGGEWSGSTSCSTRKCENGCCVYGTNFDFITERTCEKLSGLAGFEKDWRQISYLDCRVAGASQIEGACVKGKTCKFETESECVSDRGTFFEGVFCSDDGLKDMGIDCEAHSSKGCIEENELLRSVYWFDSCGQREEVAEVCNYPMNSCSEENGEFTCKDLGCKGLDESYEGNGGGETERKNGEKWCLYDGHIGDGRDTVGSEHWLASCTNGELEIDRCGEYRSSLCQQYTHEDTVDGKEITFTIASCVPNSDTGCQKITSDYFDSEMTQEDLDEMLEDCEGEEHCMINDVSVGYFKFSTCVPKYPKGDILTDNLNGNVCDLAADRSCKVIYKKTGLFNVDSWVPEENSCETETFAKEMNDFCISIGDCGSKVNFIGEGTDNVKMRGKKGYKLDSDGKELSEESMGIGSPPAPYSWTNYRTDGDITEWQSVPPKDINEDLIGILGSDYTPEAVTNWSLGFSGVGGIALAVSFAYAGLAVGEAIATEMYWVSLRAGLNPAALQIASAPFLNVLGAAAIGAALGWIFARWLNLSPQAVYNFIIAGAFAGAGLILLFPGLLQGGELLCTTVYGCIAGIVLIVIAALIAIFSFEVRESRSVSFNCLPWVAPRGETKCDECNKDPLRGCTAYRCSALGQWCELENARTEHPVCISLKPTTIVPVISKGEIITEGHEFGNENENEAATVVEVTGYLQEFERIRFNLSTSREGKPVNTQCLYSFSKPPMKFEEMEGELPEEENLYSAEHTFDFRMPSLDNENVENVHEVEGGAKEGELNMYVKCADGQEPPVSNIRDYIIHFQITSMPDENVVDFNKMFTEPLNGATLKYGTIESNVKLWTYERANCKYDAVAGRSYDLMQFSFSPLEGEPFDENPLRGWLSSTKLTGLIAGTNTFYIKCKDVSGNINTEDFVYTLKVSESELKVDSITASYGIQKVGSEGTIIVGIEPVTISVEVKTSGGLDDGNSICEWGVLAEGKRYKMSPYYELANVHTQTMPKMRGYHWVYVDCTDDAENKASGVIAFTVDADEEPPKIVRVSKDKTNLKIMTDEKAYCYYSLSGCNFDLKNGTAMTATFSQIHSTAWKQGNVYHVKCQDIFGNTNPECAMKIVPIL